MKRKIISNYRKFFGVDDSISDGAVMFHLITFLVLFALLGIVITKTLAAII